MVKSSRRECSFLGPGAVDLNSSVGALCFWCQVNYIVGIVFLRRKVPLKCPYIRAYGRVPTYQQS